MLLLTTHSALSVVQKYQERVKKEEQKEASDIHNWERGQHIKFMAKCQF